MTPGYVSERAVEVIVPDDTSIRVGRPEYRSHVTSRRLATRPPFECIALLLQGGGALGSYQAGVYEALAEADLHPDWVAGISIGAINSAIIAGNLPTERVAKLRAFWEGITANPLLDWAVAGEAFTPKGDLARGLFNQMSAAWALVGGAAGFFALRQPAPWLHPNGDTGGEVILVVIRPSGGRRTMSNGSGRSGCRSPSLRSAPG